jgi:hypothetical protein
MAATANVTIHHSAWSDSRYDVLASCIGLDKYAVIGRMARLWSECTDLETDTPAEYIVIGCIGSDLACEALIKSGLAEKTASGIRIKGCHERIGWLKKKRASGKAGAAATNAKFTAKKPVKPRHKSGTSAAPPQHVPRECHADAEGSPRPQVLRYSGTQESNNPITQEETERRASSQPSHSEAVHFFHKRFLAAYGSAPSWQGKNSKLMSTLVKSHSSAEVIRRTEILFDSPPAWLKPPFDVGTLSQHFDKLVAPSQGSAVSVAFSELKRLERDAELGTVKAGGEWL